VDNWQTPPFNRWAFQHMREVIPSQVINRGAGQPRALRRSSEARVLDDLHVDGLEGHSTTVGKVLAETYTDAVLVLHHGEVVLERYADSMAPDTPHLLMSVSKSLVGCVAGILADRGLVDLDEQVVTYVPEVSGSGYAGATVRHLLDMRTGVAFSEDYTDSDSEVSQMERHMGWAPEEEPALGAYGFLTTLGRAADHGGPFVYRSADTDMLGWVCERAADTRMADLLAHLIWQRIGAEHNAEVTCDSLGTAIHDGGVSATLRDLGRFGQLLMDDGFVDDAAVVPAGWLQSSRAIDPAIRAAFAASESEPFLPGGWYRNQFWFVPGPSGDVQLCLGIHGQMVLVDRATATVGVKLSTWPDPQNPRFLIDTIRTFTTMGRALAGLPAAGSAAGRTSDVVSVP
ncbi:MAG: serine hydrolase domain-containing protein, partial [Nocardioidaceae bacterium]